MTTDPNLTPIEGFNVRIVNEGDTFGRDDCMTHTEEEPLVEFYDPKQDPAVFGPRGQFIGRYYCDTIVNGDYPRGLCLDGGVPAWSISAHGMRSVKAFLRQRMASAV